MPAADKNPERRNLMMTSLAFIVFYLGDARPIENEIRLMFINLHFSDAQALIYMAYTMWGWFFWRYWIQNKGSVFGNLRNDVSAAANEKPRTLAGYVSRDTELVFQSSTPGGFVVKALNWKNTRFGLPKRWAVVARVYTNYEKAWQDREIPLVGFSGKVVLFKLYMAAIFTRDSFGALLIPYLLTYASLAVVFYHELIL